MGQLDLRAFHAKREAKAAKKVDIHSTFTPSTFLWYDVIKNDEGK